MCGGGRGGGGHRGKAPAQAGRRQRTPDRGTARCGQRSSRQPQAPSGARQITSSLPSRVKGWGREASKSLTAHTAYQALAQAPPSQAGCTAAAVDACGACRWNQRGPSGSVTDNHWCCGKQPWAARSCVLTNPHRICRRRVVGGNGWGCCGAGSRGRCSLGPARLAQPGLGTIGRVLIESETKRGVWCKALPVPAPSSACLSPNTSPPAPAGGVACSFRCAMRWTGGESCRGPARPLAATLPSLCGLAGVSACSQLCQESAIERDRPQVQARAPTGAGAIVWRAAGAIGGLRRS